MNSPIQSAEATVTNSGNRAMSSIKNFLNSNTLVSKVVFIILIVIGFVIALQFGTTLLGYLFEPASSPVLVSGMKDAKKVLIIPQDPKNPNSIPVMRSTNQDKGLEFTWTVWLYLDDLVYKNGQKKHIFHKGSGNFKEQTAFPNNGPGLYIHPTRNSLIVVMNTFKNIMEEVEITDFPMHKWVNVAIRVEGKTMDVFVNGDVALRHVFDGVPKQNYGDVFVNLNGGFSGKLSDLQYHNYTLSGTGIMDIVRRGPDLSTTKSEIAIPPYLSLQWFFQQSQTPTNSNWPTDA
jgi:hypothetical protein